MKFSQFLSPGRLALAFLTIASISCSDDDSTAPPALEAITVTLPASTIEMGQTVTATATGLDQYDDAISLGSVAWSSSSANATIDAAGVVTGATAGTARIIATVGDKTGEQTITVTAPAALIFNEVESNGGTPGDWAEIYNPTGAAVDISGWMFRDNDNTHTYTFPAGSVIAANGYLVVEEMVSVGVVGFDFGLGAADTVRLFNKFGVLATSYGWTTHAPTTYGRCPNLTGEFTINTTSTKGAANDCSVAVKVNEVESNGGTPGDWIELYNAGPAPANLAGFVVKDNDDTHGYTIPAGTTLAPGAYLVIEEAALGFGLGTADAARLFNTTNTLVDSYTWTAHAATTYGRCPNGTGAFETTASSTKNLVNACAPVGPVTSDWPGLGTDVQTVDATDAFVENLSGLTYEGTGASAVLWAVKNGPGTLYRLVWNGTIWTMDATNSWGAGKALRYMDGTGNPDTEGVTFAATGSANGIYVSTERNNDASTVSRNSILRFDPTQAGATLTATNDWNITSDLPVVGANLGIEAITWVPDSYLTTNGFYDEKAGHTYVPAEYPNHGTGLFFVGVEGNGNIYAYALNHATNGFTRIAVISTGFSGVMGLEFDRDVGQFWATCDDTCQNKSAILAIDKTAGSPTLGRFKVARLFNRPSSLPDKNNEGFAIAPESECVSGRKYVFWSDDGNTDHHAIRRGTVSCGIIP